MAKPRKQAAEIPSPTEEAPKTGLGETIEEVEAKCKAALKVLAPYFRKDAGIQEALDAAYAWAMPEKRARKLRKKIGR